MCRKPHIRRMRGGFWWCFNSRAEAYRKDGRGWHGHTPAEAYQRWANFNTMKP